MKRAWRLSQLGKLQVVEFLSLLFSFCALPISVFNGNALITFIALIIFIVIGILLIIKYKRGKEKRSYPKYYLATLYLLTIAYLLFFVIVYVIKSTNASFSLLLFSALYLLAGSFLIYLLCELIFIFFVKKLFPYELNTCVRSEAISFKQLSKYIDLEKQKLFVGLSFSNLIVYLGFIFFLILLVIKYYNGDQLTYISQFADWVKKQSSITLFN